MTQLDYSKFGDEDEGIGENLMTVLTGLADQQEAAEAEVARLTELLAEASKNVLQFSETDIPNALEGLEGKFKLPDGRTVTIKEDIRVSLSKDNKPKGIIWLNNNGHSAIVKRKFEIDFGKGDDKWADKFERDLAKRKKPLNVKRGMSVHAGTLKAFVKQALEDGVDIPQKLFGVYRQRVAKIK